MQVVSFMPCLTLSSGKEPQEATVEKTEWVSRADLDVVKTIMISAPTRDLNVVIQAVTSQSL
jgi:hypothetical protein